MAKSEPIEFRNTQPINYAADKNQLTGYAAVFYREGDEGTEFRPFEGHREIINPSAFNSHFERGGDVYATFNHDDDNLLGRESAGTLHMSVDSVGLKYTIDLPNTTVGRNVAESARRGDLKGSSFQFVVTDQRLSRDDEGNTTREIMDVNPLIELGPVTNPAFEGTSVSARSTAAIQCVVSAYETQRIQRQREDRLKELTDKVESHTK